MSNAMAGIQKPSMQKDEWLTPPWIISQLQPFDLDPCSPAVPPWHIADRWYYENGLNKPWEGFVWLNPPYGRSTGEWLEKLADHNNGIALIFARTETKIFFNYVWNRASCILFIKGRLHFYDAEGKEANNNAGAPSCLIGYGHEACIRIQGSNIEGKYLPLKNCISYYMPKTC